jgi:protein-S-isoprenylcysteine O-methyltransferase Ste14
MPLKEDFERQGNWLFRRRSYLPLLVIGIILIGMRYYKHPGHSQKWDDIWEIVCITITFFGESIRIHTVGFVPVGTSGRNTHGQAADALNTTGMYSIVRHPLYVGNFFIALGISMFICLWWMILICILVFWLYYERVAFAEEEFLRKRFGKGYLEWATMTPAFFPKLKNWRPANLAFSLKTVLKREYSGIFGIIAAFTFLEVTGDIFAEGRFKLELTWSIIFSAGLIFYLVLMFIKKKTKILYVTGR